MITIIQGAPPEWAQQSKLVFVIKARCKTKVKHVLDVHQLPAAVSHARTAQTRTHHYYTYYTIVYSSVTTGAF